MKLTMTFSGDIINVKRIYNGLEIEFDPKNMDLWQDQIEMWLNGEFQQDYAKFRIKNDKMTEFKKS